MGAEPPTLGGTWPRSSGEPLEDIDLKRRGKVDPGVREKVLQGAGEPGRRSQASSSDHPSDSSESETPARDSTGGIR